MKSQLTIQTFNEIPVQEQQELIGGFWHIVGALALIAVEEIVKDWDNFKNGLTGKPEEK